MDEQKLGIETVKPFIKTIVNTTKEIIGDVKDDGKMSKMEILALGDNVYQIGSNLMKAKTILAELKDADSDERRELVAYTISLGIGEGDVQEILEHTYLYLEGQWELYNAHLKPIIEIIKKRKG